MSREINYAEIEQRVTKRINKRREFYTHAAVYIVVNAGLWMLWAVVNATGVASQMMTLAGDNTEMISSSFPWPIIVMLGWGIGLAIHAFEYFTADAMENMKQREIEREIEREKMRLYGDPFYEPGNKRKRRAGTADETDAETVRLGADGELLTDADLNGAADDMMAAVANPKRRN